MHSIRTYLISTFFIFFLIGPSLIRADEADEKVLIFTYSYNRADFIEIQHKTFKAFLKDDYEFIVFNDATNPDFYNQIHQTCANLNIRCIDIPQSIHASNEPSRRNGAVVDFSLENLGFTHQGIVALLDSDLFLIKEFSIKEYMQNHMLSGIPQSRSSGEVCVDYLWIGLVFLDMKHMPNKESIGFSPGVIKGINTDTGGYTHYYLSNNPTVPVRAIDIGKTSTALKILEEVCTECSPSYSLPCTHKIEKIKAYGFDEKQIQFINANGILYGGDFFLDASFYHYTCGSNWTGNSNEFHLNKTLLLNDYIHSILSDKKDE